MHGLQHSRLPCPSLSPRVCSNSCPLSQWCSPTISSSVALFSCPQSFPASWSFPVSRLFTSSGQGIGASASTPVLPMNIQGWYPLGLTGLISLKSKDLSRVFSNTMVKKPIIQHSAFIKKTKIMASGPITSWQIDGETVETVTDFILGGSKITADGDCSYDIKRRLLLGRKIMTKKT